MKLNNILKRLSTFYYKNSLKNEDEFFEFEEIREIIKGL